MVFFDCERLKVTDTGIFYFCRNLASSLLKAAAREGMDITIFLRKKNAGFFGKECGYLTYRSLYKYFFPYWKLKDGVWHSAFQYPLIMPERKRTVLTIHDLNYLYEDIPDTEKAVLKDKVQAAIDKAAYIVTISEYTKKDVLRNLDTGNKPISVIYNGCNEYTGPIERPPYVPQGPFIFSIGALLPKKNFHTLPCLLEDNDMELVISGPGGSGYENTIMEEARKSGVADRVHITGAVRETWKHWYLKNCTAFIFPSIAEGFGLPALEAMYYGKPTFLSLHTSLPEIGSDKAFYFNYDFDRHLMKEAFNSGMEDFRSGKITAEEISSYARTFSWDKAASQYIEIYKQLSNGVYDV